LFRSHFLFTGPVDLFLVPPAGGLTKLNGQDPTADGVPVDHGRGGRQLHHHNAAPSPFKSQANRLPGLSGLAIRFAQFKAQGTKIVGKKKKNPWAGS
jgi:hypothetical protein